MATRTPGRDWQRAMVTMAGAVLAVVVIAALYWARAVLIPLALAVFLAFLLGPLVTFLQSRGLRRGAAVFAAVFAATLLLGAVGWTVGRQMIALADELQKPRYSDNIKNKVETLRRFVKTVASNRLVRGVSQELDIGPSRDAETDSSLASPPADSDAPSRPIVVQEASAWTQRLGETVSSVTEPLAGMALAVVLVVFMLLNRESLRNRLLRLAGQAHLMATTRAVDDAAQRISRFLLAQLLVNSMFGLALAAGLLVLGVHYALLWGFLAALLRYVPYVGAWIAAIPPLLLSLALFEGWGMPLAVLGFIAVLELVTNNAVEPLVYGHSMGVSEVALLVAAAFWTFLWGPIGLVLSSPLTVCLVVLGKHVPQLQFIDILLGDEPALSPSVSFYQRLLARDRVEATEIVGAHARNSSVVDVFQEFLIPALSRMKRDRRQRGLSDDDAQFILESIDEIVAAHGPESKGAEGAARETGSRADSPARVSLLACPARDEADRLALEMLRHVLNPDRWEVTIVGVEILASELIEMVGGQKPAIVCIASLPPGGQAHAQYLCKRLRAQFPELKVIVGRFGSKLDLPRLERAFSRAGADHVEATLQDMQSHLSAWLPILARPAMAPAPLSDHAA